jgi:hypothetical protein
MTLAAVSDAPVLNVDIEDTSDNVLNASEAVNATISGSINAGSTLDSIEITDGVHAATVLGANVTIDASGNYSVSGVDLSSLADGKLTVTAHATSADGTTGTSTDTITKDATAGNISVSVEDPGSDHLYSRAEVGSDGTVTATVTLPQDAIAGDKLTVNSVDHVLTSQDIAAGHVDYQMHPSDGVLAIFTDQAGNQSNIAHVQVADLAPDAPTFVTPPIVVNTGTPHITGTLDGGTGTGGWALAGPNGQPVQQMTGKYGTLRIDPDSGQVTYEYSHGTTMGQKAQGGTHSAGQVISQTDHDVFHVLLHSANHSDVDVEVNVNIEFIHGHSGQNKDTTRLVGMTIHDPAGVQQHDEIPDQPEDIFTATLDIADAPSEDHQVLDSYMAFAASGESAVASDTPVPGTASDGGSPLDGYLNAAGVDSSQVVAGHPQGADPSLDPALLDNSAADQTGSGSELTEQVADMSDVEIPDHLLDPEHLHQDG